MNNPYNIQNYSDEQANFIQECEYVYAQEKRFRAEAEKIKKKYEDGKYDNDEYNYKISILANECRQRYIDVNGI